MNAQAPGRGRQPVTAKAGRWSRLIAIPLHKLLDSIDDGLVEGSLEASLPDGSVRILGGRSAGPQARITLVKWRALLRLAHSGSVGWYEAWAAGEWTSPDPVPIFALFMQNRTTLGRAARAKAGSRIVKRIRHALRRNDRTGAKRNILAHYDLGNDFYAAWLDSTMTYSSALFDSFAEPLELAQVRKIDCVLTRLDLKVGDKFLEIGCGWGALLEAAKRAGADVTGVTLSPSQKAYADARLGGEGSVLLADYREIDGRYDAIASVEMVEAVGQRYWPTFVDRVARSLKPGGRAVLQYITIADDIFERYAASADFIQTYIFPGGMLMSQSRLRALAETRGLRWHDQSDFGQHYAQTLRCWRANFDAAVEQGRLPPAFDARFIALWRYYLMYCEGGFDGGGIQVSQVTLIRD